MTSNSITPKRILVTGASGCIGHYLTEALIQDTTHELYLLVRNPAKLRLDRQARPGIHVIQGDLRDIDRFADLLKTIQVAILTATAWGGPQEVCEVNVLKTLQLLTLLEPECEQVLYFSTASILDSDHQLLPAAGQIGHDYIRSKYDCFLKLSELAIAPRITTLFPTLVFGGDAQKPYSHLSSGIPEVLRWSNLIRFFSADGSFHFIHAQDIAQVVRHLVDHPPTVGASRQLVLGNDRTTVDQAIAEVCAYLNKKIYLQIPLSLGLANLLIPLFQIQMSPWDRYYLQQRHFYYNYPVNPTTFGLPTYCPTLSDVLKVSGISGVRF